MEVLERYRRNFHLVGESVVRTRTGKDMSTAKHNKMGYQYVNVEGVPHLLHRIKFGLKYGYLPKEVDHEDRNPFNNSFGNLRRSGRSRQMHNRRPRRPGGLPRGVYAPRGKRKKYLARITVDRRTVFLGFWSSAEEASEAVEAMLALIYGEYYAPH